MIQKIFSKLGIHDKQSFKKVVLQFIKFGIVGVSNTLVNLGIYYLLVYLGVPYLLANLAGFLISTLNAFLWNRRFVFKNAAGSQLGQLLKTYIAYGVTFLLSSLLLFLFVDVLGISEWVAPLLSLLVTIPTNFLVNKFWTFKQSKAEQDSSPKN